MKIPKPRKRGDSYRIEIMFDGKRYSCTRDTPKECEHWATIKLLELKTGRTEENKPVKPTITWLDLFNQYYDNVGKHTDSKAWNLTQLKSFEKKVGNLANTLIYDITPKQLTTWRNKRLKEVSDNTVLKEISLYSAMFTYAQKELFLITENPWMQISKPSKPDSRYRRISQQEIEKILKILNYEVGQTPTQSDHYVAWAFLFAIETAMRRGEILNMLKSDIYDGYVHLPKTKNGTKRNVPLSAFAKELVDLISHDQEKIIPQSENAFRQMWEKRKAKTDIHDLHFHDTRHEAISRMVKVRKLPVEVLAKITGHKKIEVLVNVYYNPDAQELVDMFNGSAS
ncbi:tyrosine-type recombinase/integrase [Acinetobacter baumannii]